MKRILLGYIAGLLFVGLVFVLMIKLASANEELGEKEFEGYRAVDIELISRSTIKDGKKLTQAQTLQEEKHMLQQSLNQN